MWPDVRILVANSDPSSRDLVAVLKTAGYEVLPASVQDLASGALAPVPLHLILLEVGMSGAVGLEVLRRFKAGTDTQNIPVILTSSADAMEQCIEGLALGAVDFLVKPLRPEEVIARVRTHLDSMYLRTDLKENVARRMSNLHALLDQIEIEVQEQRRGKLTQHDSKEFHRLAMGAGRMFAFECDPSSGKMQCSEHCAKMLGLRSNKSCRWPEWMRHIHSVDREILTKRIGALTPDNNTSECEYRVYRPEGQVDYHCAVVRALFDSGGHVTRYIGIVADATQTRQAEAALHEGERRFQHLADAAPMMIGATGPDKGAIYFNKAWLSFTGRTLEQELGDGWMEGVHPDDLERTVAGYRSNFEARRPCHLEYRLRRADGEYRWVVCSGAPQFASDGTFTGYVGTCIDTTDLKRAREEKFDQERGDSLRVLTGGIAHDFNNLLGGILVETELAETEIAEGISPVAGIRRIRAVATRAAEIVRELMIYSGQDKATLEPVNLSVLVKEMLELLRISISKLALLRTDLANDLPAVLGSTSQLRQVVMNLILNASDALGHLEGWIQIKTAKLTVGDEEPGSGATGLPEGEYVRLTVSDSGCGMNEDVRARIFEPFFTTKSRGHGLGLALMQGIVRSHGGSISVASELGQGTTFEVLLPSIGSLVGNAVPSGHAAPEKAPAIGTVLLVENEDSLRVGVGKALQRRGVSVLSAADPRAGIDLLRAHALEVVAVVLDMTLQGMSIEEMLREIDLIRPHVPVILTSVQSADAVGDTLGGNFATSGFLRKPYRIAELVSLLQAAIPGRQQGESSASASG